MATLNVIYRIAADITGLKDGVEQAASTMERLESAAESVAGAFGIGLGLRELVEFGQGAIEAAHAINDLHLATGVSLGDLQRMAYVGAEFGLSMDDIGRAVEKLTERLATKDPSAVKAIDMLGLSVRDLLALGPTEAFLSVAEAAGQVEDPMARGGIAAEAFGTKIGRLLLPVLGDLRQRMQEVPMTAIIEDANITKAAEFDDALKHLSMRLKGLAVDLIALPSNVASFWSFMLTSDADLLKSIDQTGLRMAVSHQQASSAAQQLAVSHQQATAAVQAHLSVTDLLNNRLKALRDDAAVPLTDAVKKQITELHQWGISEQEIADLTQTNVVAVHQFVEAQTLATEVAKRFATASMNIAGVLTGHAGVNQGIADQVRLLLELGASQSDIAIKFGITQGAVASLAKEMERLNREAQAALSFTNKLVVDNLNALAALKERWTGFSLSGNAIPDQSPAGQMQQAQQSYQQQLDSLHRTATPGIDISAIELKLYQDFQDAFAKAAAAADGLSDAHAGATVAAQNAGSALDGVGRSSADVASAFARFSGQMLPQFASSLNGFLQSNNALAHSYGPTFKDSFNLAPPPSLAGFGGFRAAGGAVSAGVPYMVGERGAELFVPTSDGAILPNGSTGGPTSITVNVSGLMLSTDPRARAQVAALVDDAVRSALDRTGRKRGTV